MAYGTKIADFTCIEAAEKHAFDSAYFWGSHPLEVLYRAEAISYSYCLDPEREEYGSTAPQIELVAYAVQRWTEHGVTLRDVMSGSRQKWVDLRPGAKQWASRTGREAVEQLKARRQRQLYVLNRQLECAKWELALAISALDGRPIFEVLKEARSE